MTCITSHRIDKLTGAIIVPGDKSISHRALILGASAVGETIVNGLLEGEDVMTTAKALKDLGTEINKNSNGSWSVFGRGVGGLSESSNVLDMGNTGTGMRLLLGLLASHPFNTIFTGDASLKMRPMDRVVLPLERMGAVITTHSGNTLPLLVKGSDMLQPITETLKVASAQVKSAILLAGLNTRGKTTVIEPLPTRDHTENMLAVFGADISNCVDERGTVITLTGQPELHAKHINIPGDLSSAAFPMVAALISPSEEVVIQNICLNPFRTGLIDTLKEMGARITIKYKEAISGENLGDIFVQCGPLKGVQVPSERVPKMIDEYPILAVAAACAEGETIFEGVSELRFKESDRLAAIARGLTTCKVEVEETENRLTIFGKGKPPWGGCQISSNMDHRIAMAFLVLGMVTERPIVVDDANYIETSFPGFIGTMNHLGGNLKVEKNL